MTGTDPTRCALAHPVRMRMMTLLRDTPMSAAELGRALGVRHALAVRHLHRLADAGLVAPVEDYRYRAVDQGAPSGASAAVLSLADRGRRVGRAPAVGAYGPGADLDTGLWPAPDAWDDFRYRLAAMLIALHDEARAPRPPEPGPGPGPAPEPVGARVMAFPIGR